MLTLAFASAIGLILGWLMVSVFLGAGGPAEAPSGGAGEPEDAGAGFMSSAGIKTLLLSGAALVLWSAYLFVRSYWTSVPDLAKFGGLAVLGALSHAGGLFLSRRGWVPRTARTLVGLGLALSPFIVYSVRVWVAPGLWEPTTAWALGLAFLAVLAGLTALSAPAWEEGFLLAGGFIGAAGLGVMARLADGQWTLAAAAVAAAGAVALGYRLRSREDVSRGIDHAAFTAWIAVAGTLAYQGFYWHAGSQWGAFTSMVFLASGAALAARWSHPAFAFPAAAAVVGAGALLLRQLDLPLYQYGAVFGPMGYLALLRARGWEKAENLPLSRAVFWFGHLCLLFSTLALAPVYVSPGTVSLSAALGVIGLLAAAYGAAGFLQASPFYAYAAGTLLLLGIGAWARVSGAVFTEAVLGFTGAGAFLWAAGLAGGIDGERWGRPWTVLAMGTLTGAMGLLAGDWGQQVLLRGSVAGGMSPAQGAAGLWTGGVSVVAYGTLAFIRRKAVFIYPLFYSLTWVALCVLESLGIRVSLVHLAGVCAGAMALHYLLDAFGVEEVSRGARLWGVAAYLLTAWASLVSAPPSALKALLICTLSFLPGVWKGKTDISLSFLSSFYLAHYLFFCRQYPDPAGRNWALYALQGVAVNGGVVFVRTLLTYLRPEANLIPYRLAAFLFALLGLGLSLGDLGIAWQVFGAYGVIALAVSLLHYQGRFAWVGAGLLAASLEIFFYHHGARYVEAYTWPLAILLAGAAWLSRDSLAQRNIFYGLAQITAYGPSFPYALVEHWGPHGLMLGVASLAGLLVGVGRRSRCLTSGSAFVLLSNAAYQSRDWFWSLPGWIYLGLGGLGLIFVAALFEFRRETLLRAKDALAEVWDRWE